MQAHGGGVIKSGDTYYWFGEDKSHNSALFKAVSVYASKDLIQWEFRNQALTIASDPANLTNAKIERPKVMYNEKTKKYIMWGHWEVGSNYNEANAYVAVSDTVVTESVYGSTAPTCGIHTQCERKLLDRIVDYIVV
ncbi:beta-xylosidase [Paenibacillus sp. V4I9]|uniref:hypothetical protein n=1 Tax=Paenibacillus sp. V4I9 TaxID=3042308 RepID=UPI0027849534|nr:hypothetical protein [Paenibacillus sp. V4I9]MDQ0887780.1 beta-xylosidase [Paenibacillus sp. V4I9]